jgi:hypothetical protein
MRAHNELYLILENVGQKHKKEAAMRGCNSQCYD